MTCIKKIIIIVYLTLFSYHHEILFGPFLLIYLLGKKGAEVLLGGGHHLVVQHVDDVVDGRR